MKVYTFVIKGNQVDPVRGNPLPKVRFTGKQSWRPEVQKYARWKEYVRGCFLGYLMDQKLINHAEFRGLAYGKTKPIVLAKDARAFMEIKIQWSSKVHGDPEGMFGSIADALFDNDKNLAGSFDFEYSSDKKAMTFVTIRI